MTGVQTCALPILYDEANRDGDAARWYLHAVRGEPAESSTLAAQLKDLAPRIGTPDALVLALKQRVLAGATFELRPATAV